MWREVNVDAIETLCGLKIPILSAMRVIMCTNTSVPVEEPRKRVRDRSVMIDGGLGRRETRGGGDGVRKGVKVVVTCKKMYTF